MNPPKGWKATDTRSTEWRSGYVFSWSGVFLAWVKQPGRVTIRPQETGKEAAERLGVPLADTEAIFISEAL